METLLAGFTLGNAAILTNVCLLPLYPGFMEMLALEEARQPVKKVTTRIV